jgi:cytochrome c oxidase subunit II
MLVSFLIGPAVRKRWCPLAIVGLKSVLSVAGLVVLASTAAADVPVQTPNIFAPVSTPARLVFELSLLVLGITATIFVVVTGLLVCSIVRFRRRPGDDGREPPQVYGSNQVELAWTVVPLLIVFVLFLATTRTIVAVQNAEPPPDALKVTVIGRQWWWEFHYPELGIITANELHVPVSDPVNRRPTVLTLQSDDVVHSFWVPRLAGKTDVVPNRENHMWIEPMEAGLYVGQCAEYCGTQHAYMLLRVIVHPQDEFERWVADQRKPPVADSKVRVGRDLFFSTACINCHTVGDTVATGTFGPDLTHLMSRETIGAGVAANTPENLRAWTKDPDHLKPGVHMPAMKLTNDEVDKVVAYLLTLK